jgi:hypothetical protein
MTTRNQPVKLDPLNPRKREREAAPSGPGNSAAQDGYSRLSTREPYLHGQRKPIGGTNVYSPYREDC